MANDVPDYTSNVQVVGGTITIGSGSVSVSGTVSLSAGTTVNVASVSGTVTITGSVTITGTPTVQFAAGQTVSISGTPTVQFAAGQSVSISGTATVQFAAGQTVSITSGSVNITGGQGGTNTYVSMQTPPVQAGTLQFTNGTLSNTATITVDNKATGIQVMYYAPTHVATPATAFVEYKITGTTTNQVYASGRFPTASGGAISLPAAAAQEGTLSVYASWSQAANASQTAAAVYNLYAEGSTVVTNPPYDPVPVVPVSAITSDCFLSGSTSTTGLQTLWTANFNPSNPFVNPRFLRSVRGSFGFVSGGAAVMTSVLLELVPSSGSDPTITLAQFVYFPAGSNAREFGNLLDVPIDIDAMFPNSTSVALKSSSPLASGDFVLTAVGQLTWW